MDNVINELVTRASPLILHAKDWQQRLGEPRFSLLLVEGGLVEPLREEIEDEIFSYYLDNLLLDVEIQFEDDGFVIIPEDEGIAPLTKKGATGLLKFDSRAFLNFVARNNKLSSSEITLKSNHFSILGELQFGKCRFMVMYLLSNPKNMNNILENLDSVHELKKFESVFILTGSQAINTLGKNNLHFTAFDPLGLLPAELFWTTENKINAQQLASHFEYPLLIDEENKFFYSYGKKIGRKSDTLLYNFVAQLVKCKASLPIPKATFFSMHNLTVMDHDSATKQIRRDLRENIEKINFSEEVKEKVRVMFDLVTECKEWGQIDLKIPSSSIHVLRSSPL